MTNENLVLEGAWLGKMPESRGGTLTVYKTNPVNLRVLDDKSIDLSKFEIRRVLGSSFPPAYVNP